MRNKYALVIDAIAKMPFGTTPFTSLTRYIYAACEPITGKVHIDQTGAMLITSISGNKYLFILHDGDSNYIDDVSIPSLSKLQILQAYQSSHSLLKSRGIQPRLQCIDNEVSTILKQFMHKENIDFQVRLASIH